MNFTICIQSTEKWKICNFSQVMSHCIYIVSLIYKTHSEYRKLWKLNIIILHFHIFENTMIKVRRILPFLHFWNTIFTINIHVIFFITWKKTRLKTFKSSLSALPDSIISLLSSPRFECQFIQLDCFID